MNVVVLLAGIADPKWPLAIMPDGRSVANKRILSPFDEAALEIALKIRESSAGAALTFIVVGERESEPLIRRVAAFRPDQLIRLDTGSSPCWDARQLSGRLAAGLAGFDPSLVLIGREFGDADDGAVPPSLAEELGWTFFGLCQAIRKEVRLSLLRETEDFEEWIEVDRPIVASVTNDRRNRLRRPLMKNVMLARTAPFTALPSACESPAGLPRISIAPAEPQRRGAPCRMLGGTPGTQAAELIAFLSRRS